MRISHASLYAIRAALFLCESDSCRPIPCSELAFRGQLSVRFLNQILGKLVKRGVLRSAIGVSGGYALDRPPEQITLLELITDFEQDFSSEMLMSSGLGDQAHQHLLRTLTNVSDAARRELQKVTLADLKRLSVGSVTPNAQAIA